MGAIPIQHWMEIADRVHRHFYDPPRQRPVQAAAAQAESVRLAAPFR